MHSSSHSYFSQLSAWLSFCHHLNFIGWIWKKREGEWIWTNGDPVNGSYWDEDQPSNAGDEEHCAETNRLVDQQLRPGKWNDESCTKKRHFVCEASIGWFLQYKTMKIIVKQDEWIRLYALKFTKIFAVFHVIMICCFFRNISNHSQRDGMNFLWEILM